MNKRVGILIQSRLSSSRLPGKMLLNIGNIPLVKYVYKRCLVSLKADMVGVITSVEKSDDLLYKFCKNSNIPVFRGSLDNVLDRYIQAAEYFNLDFICRVCGDSPFIDIFMADFMMESAVLNNYEYVSFKNSIDGFLSEIVQKNTLDVIKNKNLTLDELEHVTFHIRSNLQKFNTKMFYIHGLNKNISLTVDNEEDLLFCSKVDYFLKKMIKFNKFNFTSYDVVQSVNMLH